MDKDKELEYYMEKFKKNLYIQLDFDANGELLDVRSVSYNKELENDIKEQEIDDITEVKIDANNKLKNRGVGVTNTDLPTNSYFLKRGLLKAAMIATAACLNLPVSKPILDSIDKSIKQSNEIDTHSDNTNDIKIEALTKENLNSIVDDKLLELDNIVSSIEEEIIISEYDQYLNIYSSYYNLDGSKVIELARLLTNNYQDDFSGIINNDLYDLSNIEASCIIFISNLQKNNLAIKLEDMGYTAEIVDESSTLKSLKLSNDVYGNEGGNFIMSNGSTFSQNLGRISDLIGVDKIYALAICYCESGQNGSEKSKFQNNFSGMRGTSGFYTYPTPEAGIIEHCMNLKKYENYNLTSEEELYGLYVWGNRYYSESNESVWLNNLRGSMQKINDNYDDYFYLEDIQIEEGNNKSLVKK